MSEPSTVALVFAAFFLGGVVKGSLGLGLPVVVLAVLAPVMELKHAMALVLAPAIITNIWQALNGPDLTGLVQRMWSFLAVAVIGIWAGTSVLARVDGAILTGILGVLLCVYSAVSLTTPQVPPPGRREVWMSPVAGGLGGVLLGMTGIFIVPGILYLQALGMRRDLFVQALGLTFITISLGLALSMGGRSMITTELAVLSALAVVPSGVGLWLGTRVRKRISEEGFRRIFFVALIFTGVYMIWRALG